MWVVLNKAHVLARITDHELESYELTGDQTPEARLEGANGIIEQVTTLIRGYVAGCKENLAHMGTTGTIPDELLWVAVAIARNSLMASVSNTQELEGDEREREYNDAMSLLKCVSRCEFAIAGTGEPIASAPTSCYGGDCKYEF